jgi:hypothetical protein
MDALYPCFYEFLNIRVHSRPFLLKMKKIEQKVVGWCYDDLSNIYWPNDIFGHILDVLVIDTMNSRMLIDES